MNSDLDIGGSPNDLEKILSRIKAAGESYIDLTASNPTVLNYDYDGLQIPDLLASKDNLIYAPDPKGKLTAREAIGEYYQNRKNYFRFKSASNLILASGTSECYSYILKTFAKAGDEVLLPAPGYPLLEHLVRFERLNVVNYDLKYENSDWTINFNSLIDSISPQTGFIIIVSPNNPTGHTLSRNEFFRLNKICNEKRINMIIDEVFFDYIYENEFEPFLPESPDHYSIFILNGLSKITATPQLKLSWMYILPEKDCEEKISRELEFTSDAYLSVNTPVQNAVPFLLKNRNFIQQQINLRIGNNIQQLKDERFDFFNVKAGWYACIKLMPDLRDDIFCAGLLEKTHVLAHPGYYYDFQSENVIVISLILKENVFRKGIKMIRSYSDSISSDNI